jgi:predicted component of type VI protein secretion system
MSSKTTFTIGRDPSADIPVADGSVSRIHAEVTLLDGERIFVTDCNSSNGTYLVRNGAETRITQEKLGPGDWIKFGAVALSVADVVAAVRRKMGPVPPPLPPQPAPAAGKSVAVKPKRFATAAQLIRCHCGDIKAVGQPCPSCGQ